MALPMFLAMTAAEMAASGPIFANFAWMACHFSPYTQGITNLPTQLPPESLLILDDRFPCQGHSAGLVAQQVRDAVTQLNCGSVLLDFQRPADPESMSMVHALLEALPCPTVVSEPYAGDLHCPVFLSPAPLHMALEAHLGPWEGREIWLEAALCQEAATVTKDGTVFTPQFPPREFDGGFFSQKLCCCYHTKIQRDQIRFTLFDTPDSLEKKLEKAHSLGVSRAVGLYQELRDSHFCTSQK